jgi:uncharacterized protein YfaT (DUF1175 family)
LSIENPTSKIGNRKNLLRAIIGVVIGAVLVVGGLWTYRTLDAKISDFDVVIQPSNIPADGVSSALLEIRLISRFGNRLNVNVLPHAPQVEFPEGGDLVKVIPLGDSLRYRLVARFQTGSVVARVHIWGAPGPIEARLMLTPSLADRNHNGYPDLLDLTSESDRNAFRRWFVTIAYGERTHIDDRWNDRDCAGLLRYCYREALKRHDNAWLKSREWLAVSGIPDVRKYNYPDVPLVGTRVFNAGTRPSTPERHDSISVRPVGDGSNGSRGTHGMLENFSTFAEAARLKDNSLAFISRDVRDALPGDVIFYLNDTESEWPYHSMIYLGNEQTIYHTGPDGDRPGIIKQLSFAQLAAHPNPRWHPVAANPYFLGFYRWRILI